LVIFLIPSRVFYMKKLRMKLIFTGITLIIAVSGLLVFYGCDSSQEPVQLIVKSNEVTLEWDPPALHLETGPMSISSYNVYYRVHNTETWNLIDTIDAVSYPSYTIQHSLVGDGLFDFSVSAVAENGEESNLHSSVDPNADPVGGWFLLWVKSE